MGLVLGGGLGGRCVCVRVCVRGTRKNASADAREHFKRSVARERTPRNVVVGGGGTRKGYHLNANKRGALDNRNWKFPAGFTRI